MMIEPRLIFLAITLAVATGCASSTARVAEVSPRYVRAKQSASGDVQVAGGNVRINSGQVGASVRNAIGQEFFVRWTSSDVQSVTFQYRQVRHEGKVTEQTAPASQGRWHVFRISDDDFKSGGPVSAWKVSLLDASGACIADKQSVMW
jgi:hypothetical protein